MAMTISNSKKDKLSKMYYRQKMSMREIALELGCSIDAVVHFMRKNNLSRRSLKESNNNAFERKAATFRKKKPTKESKELEVIGAMLYWGEGYKGNQKNPAISVDFANSDASMIRLFLKFLRGVFELDEKKFRILLYCYADQNPEKLIGVWSSFTGIPKSQFTKPYIRNDFRSGANKMSNGLIHVRYHDKKLLLEIKKMIESYVFRYEANAPIV